MTLPSTHALRRTLVVIALLGNACRQAPPESGPSLPPPPAEFVLAAGDSAFWVSSVAGTVHVRGAPIELARVGGRFYEVYVTDDEHSFEDATFIGQRVYRRDLIRGDSALIYQDTVVPRLAREYARRHPDDAPLADGDDPSDDPRWSAVATLDLTDVHGPFVSFTTHVDVQRDDAARRHGTRRGVIDLERGGTASLATIVGTGPRVAEVERERAVLARALQDSLRAPGKGAGRRTAAVRPFNHLDPGSFGITTTDGAPAIAFALSLGDVGEGGRLVPLPPIRIGDPAWWPDVAATLPIGSVTGARDVWRHRNYEVVVHYDSSGSGARLALRDSTSREWTIARVPPPAMRIFWLDAPALDSASRRGLARAFDESTLYDESVRTASAPSRRANGRPRTVRVRHRLAVPAPSPRSRPRA